MSEYCDLTAFMNWWVASRPLNAPRDSVINDDKIHGVVLYRDGQYQVELLQVEPNSIIDEHIHPNVDSYEMYVAGDVNFTVNGISYPEQSLGDNIRVFHDDWHGGVFGPMGGVFMSFQKWLNGVQPSSVGADWADKQGNIHGHAYKAEE
jgi:quercetin dioxygenase-like cupin family protein